MLSPQDEEFLSRLNETQALADKEGKPHQLTSGAVARVIRIVGELKKELNEQIDLYLKLNDDAGTIVRGLKKERDRLREIIKESKFIRCQSPSDILVIPDNANSEEFIHVNNPCHNHSIRRRCEYMNEKS